MYGCTSIAYRPYPGEYAPAPVRFLEMVDPSWAWARAGPGRKLAPPASFQSAPKRSILVLSQNHPKCTCFGENVAKKRPFDVNYAIVGIPASSVLASCSDSTRPHLGLARCCCAASAGGRSPCASPPVRASLPQRATTETHLL